MKIEYAPQITVIIPTRPRGDVTTILESLKKANYPKEKIEVIITEGAQPARQRNEAIKIAKGDVLFFFDDDITIHPDLFNQMLKLYKDKMVAVVGGPNLTPETDSFLQKCFGHVMMSYMGTSDMCNRWRVVGVEARKATEKDLILCNLSGRRSVLQNNLFVGSLYPNEENELLNRLTLKGYKLIYNPKAIVYHSRRPSIKSFIKQNFNYGRGRAEQILIQPHSFGLLFLVPALFTLYILSLPIVRNLLYSIPLIVYIFACVVFSLSITAKQKDLRLLLVLPWIFPLVHIPYGIGFVYGFFRSFFFKRKYNREVKIRKVTL